MGFFTERIKTEYGKRLLSLLLTLALVLPMLPVSAKAVTLVNTVAVEITTGESAGDNVAFLGLNYKDQYGYTHVEYIFPHKEGLGRSYDYFTYQSSAEGDRDRAMTDMRVLGDRDYATQEVLQPYSTDTYIFELPFYIDEEDPEWFQGLDVYCEGDAGSGTNYYTWDVQSIRIISSPQGKVNLIGGSGGEYAMSVYGNQAAVLENSKGTSLSWTSDTLYQFGPSSKDDVPMKWESEKTEWNGSDEYYTVRISFADVYGGGIEALVPDYGSKKAMSDFFGQEALVMEIQYTDTNGSVVRVDVPVLNSVLATLQTQSVREDSGIAEPFEDQKLLGWAQQGETIAFTACLPNLAKVTRVTFYAGDLAQVRCDLQVINDSKISITNVSIYEGGVDGGREPAESSSVLLGDSDGNDLNEVYTFRKQPLYYHTASSFQGENIPEGNGLTMVMDPYTTGSRLDPVNNNERYLVELKATNIDFYQAPADVLLKIKYRTVKGENKETSLISVRESVRDFYGYWPASTEDFAYKAMMYQEGEGEDFGGVKFLVELRDVELFNGITLENQGFTADWQLDGIRITRLDDVEVRNGVWKDVQTGDIRSDRLYSRETYGKVIFTLDDRVLVQNGESESLDFTTGSVVQGDDVNWSEIKYAMSFDESCSDLGFTKARESYTVEVKVSGDTVSLDGNGDNGSKNHFFFRLEFEDGNSGYVLANQQLGSDGFRSGYSETFTITTNRDYGDLVAVRIIPEDISEKSDIFDKLNIEEIRVRHDSTESVSRQWLIQDVGWVGIDFRDEGVGVSIGGQKGRTEAEISQLYPVSYTSYGVNLLFNINTGSYATQSSQANSDPFYGTINGVLWYTNTVGQMVQQSFDLVEEVYKYAQRTPVYGVDENGNKTTAINDRGYMFRGNHTDRFMLSVSDVVSINRLEVNVTSQDGGSWPIDNVSIQQVVSDGMLQISDNGEYIRDGETKPLCTNVTDTGAENIRLMLPKGEQQTFNFYFPENKIEVDRENFEWVSTVSREPASQNDKINIYIYPSENVSDNVIVDASVNYTNSYGERWRTGAKALSRHRINGRDVFTVQGLSAAGMSSLNSLNIEADAGREVVDAYIDYAVVQQVRAGVVINTYRLNCLDANAFDGIEVTPGGSSEATRNEQVVTFQLGDGTESANLISEVRDIAVALRYTSSNETGGNEYQSKYQFLTDSGYLSIEENDVFTVTFQEEYVDEITGIALATTGGVVAEFEMASVGEFEVKTGSSGEEPVRTQVDWFSFADELLLKNSSQTMEPTPRTPVYPVQIDFVTAAASDTNESGTDAPVALSLGYVSVDGSDRVLEIPDVRDHVVSATEPFETGSTTTALFLMEDVDGLRWMEVEPYDHLSSKATLKLQSINVKVGEKVQRVNRQIGDGVVFEEDAEQPYRINLSDVVIDFMVTPINADTGEYENRSHTAKSTGGATKVITRSEGGAKITDINLSGAGDDEYVITTQMVTASGSVSDMSHLTRRDGDGYIFTAPANKNNDSVTYRITVSWIQAPAVAAVAEIEVLSDPDSIEDVVEDIIGDMDFGGGTSTGGSGGSSDAAADSSDGETTPETEEGSDTTGGETAGGEDSTQSEGSSDAGSEG